MLDRIPSWIARYIDYRDMPNLVEEEKDKGGLKESLVVVLIAQAVVLISTGLSIIADQAFGVDVTGQLQTMFVYLPFIVISGLVIFYTLSILSFLISKWLGGKGTFKSQSYPLAVLSVCSTIIGIPFTVLQNAPVIGIVMAIITFILGLYGFYSQYRAILSVQGLSKLRSFAALALSWVVLLLVLGFLGALPTTA